MDMFFNKTEKALRSICCCVLVIVLLNIIVSLFFSGKASFYIAGITVFVGIAGYVCVKTRIYQDNRFWINLFILGAVAKLFVGLFVHADIISDMKHCLSAAQLTVQGDMSWQEENYFIQFGFQVPFVMYEAMILKLFHSTTMLYVANALFSIATAILINRIVANMVNDTYCSWVVSAIYMILPTTFLRVSVLYNQILGGMFLALGLYFYSVYYKSKKHRFSFIASGFFLGLGHIFRQDVAIVFIAIICVEVFIRCKELSKSKPDNQLLIASLSLLLFVLGYFCAVKGLDYVLRITQLAKYSTGNNAPLYTIIHGWTPENNGAYSEKYTYLVDETANMSLLQGIRYIFNCISTKENMHFFDWVVFMIRKIYTMWGSVEGAYTLAESHSMMNLIALCIACMEVPFYCGITGCALYGIKKASDDHRALLLSVCIIGYFIAYLIVEIQPRYRYDPMICLFLLASFGIMRLKRTHSIQIN